MTITKQDEQIFYLRRLLTVLIGILIVGLIYLFYLARDFLVPVTLAIFIAITFRPVIRWLALRGVDAFRLCLGIYCFRS